MTEDMEIPKIKTIDENLKKWILLIEDPEGEEVKQMAEKEIKEAVEALEIINSDENRERIEELKEKYILDRAEEIETARVMAKEEGEKNGIRKTAKKMKEEGIDIGIIIKITGLTKEEINLL